MKQPLNLLVVCGPTASGKTALAVALATKLQGEILSADSRQIYRGLDIGSGKDLHEYKIGNNILPYHLIDIVDPKQIYTLYHYQKDCYRIISEVCNRHHLPILCGGSGLYIEAVLHGYNLPLVPENRSLRLQLMKQQKSDLEKMLLELNIDLYQLTDLSSKKRIVRAIEVAIHQTGSTSTSTPIAVPPIAPLILCTRWKRPELHERINRRLEERLSQGMIDEVHQLRQIGVPDERLLMFGMEYKFITRFLQGEIERYTMVEQLRTSIYHLAKRQDTWFRGMERRGSSIHWIDKANVVDALNIVRNHLPNKYAD